MCCIPAVGEVSPSVAEGLCSLELVGVGEGTGNSRCIPRMAWDLPMLLLTFFWLVSLLGNRHSNVCLQGEVCVCMCVCEDLKASPKCHVEIRSLIGLEFINLARLAGH